MSNTANKSAAASSWEAMPGRYVIGSAKHVDICLDGPDILPEHALLEVSGTGTVLTQIRRQAKIRVNGRPVHRAVLSYGDVVEIGSCRYVMRPSPGNNRQAPPADAAAAPATIPIDPSVAKAKESPSTIPITSAAMDGEDPAKAADGDSVEVLPGVAQSLTRDRRMLEGQVHDLAGQNTHLSRQIRQLQQVVQRLAGAVDRCDTHSDKLGEYVKTCSEDLQINRGQIRAQMDQLIEDHKEVRQQRQALTEQTKHQQGRESKWRRQVDEHRQSMEQHRQRLAGAAKGLQVRSQHQRRERHRIDGSSRQLQQQYKQLHGDKVDLHRDQDNLRQDRAEVESQRREVWELHEALHAWEEREKDALSTERVDLAGAQQDLAVRQAELAATLDELRKRRLEIQQRQQTIAVSEKAAREVADTLSAQRKVFSKQASQLASEQRALGITRLRMQQRYHQLTGKLQEQFDGWHKDMSGQVQQLRSERAGLSEARARLTEFGEFLKRTMAAVNADDWEALERFGGRLKDASVRIAEQHARIDSGLSRAEEIAQKVAEAVAYLDASDPAAHDMKQSIQSLLGEMVPFRTELSEYRDQLATARQLASELRDRPAESEAPPANDVQTRIPADDGEEPDEFEMLEFLVDTGRVDRECVRIVQRSRAASSLPLGALGQVSGVLSIRDVQKISSEQQEKGELFGQTAVRLGMMSQEQVRRLLAMQYPDGPGPIDLLVSNGALACDDLRQARSEFRDWQRSRAA